MARFLPDVSRVTLRRDIAELADAGSLKRIHGGAVFPDAAVLRMAQRHPHLVASDEMTSELDGLDGVIFPTVSGRGANALRWQIARTGIPFRAESAAQTGGIYLGPNNREAGFELGREVARSSRGVL